MIPNAANAAAARSPALIVELFALSPLRSQAQLPSRASALAETIAGDIRATALVDGAVVGTEAELCRRYSVSAPIFRQAARILDQRGIAIMRRGSFGGLVVKQDRLNAIAHALATFFAFSGVGFSDTPLVFKAIRMVAFPAASRNLDLRTVALLRRRMEEGVGSVSETWRIALHHFDLRQSWVDLAGNHALSLMNRAVSFFYLDRIPYEGQAADDRLSSLHAQFTSKLFETLIAEDFGALSTLTDQLDRGAMAQQQEDWQRAEKEIEQSRARHARVGLTSENWPGMTTLADKLARAILRDIRLRDWPVGEILGSEPELLKKYSVSRATFRQAIKLLDQYSAVQMKRGPRGGLMITSPDAGKLEQESASYLDQVGVARDQLAMTQKALSIAAIDLICVDERHYDPSALEAWCADLRALRGIELRRALGRFHSLITAASRNRVLETFAGICAMVDAPLRAGAQGPAHANVQEIVLVLGQALQEKDRSRARRAVIQFVDMVSKGSEIA